MCSCDMDNCLTYDLSTTFLWNDVCGARKVKSAQLLMTSVVLPHTLIYDYKTNMLKNNRFLIFFWWRAVSKPLNLGTRTTPNDFSLASDKRPKRKTKSTSQVLMPRRTCLSYFSSFSSFT